MHLKKTLPYFERWLLSALRIMTGALFLEHGIAKYFGIHTLPMSSLQIWSLPGIAGLLELVGGVLIMLGLFTRLTAFVLSGQMAMAYFLAHASRDFLPIVNGGELAILYCFTFLYLAAAGGGPFGIDGYIKRNFYMPKGF